jgi:hypothetical protein
MWMGKLRGIGGALLAAPLLTLAASPVRAIDGAEVELFGYSISRSGASANFGFPLESPELLENDDSETALGIHGDHDDTAYTRDRLYGGDERINATHDFGPDAARGSIEAGHSISVTTGYADAGSEVLGGFAETNAGSLGPTSVGAAVAEERIEKRITISPGESGLADGTLVTGLRWVLHGAGTLEVSGRTHPADSASSSAATLDITVSRGPTGTCGAFDCGQGAIAVMVHSQTSLSFQDENPALPAHRSGRVRRHDTWSAHNNVGGTMSALIDSDTTEFEPGLSITDEDAHVRRVESVVLGEISPVLDEIEFEANVGETLKVEMELQLAASVGGWGSGESDFFGTFAGHIEDPQGRGLVFVSSVPVPEPGAGAAGAFALALLACGQLRPARRA